MDTTNPAGYDKYNTNVYSSRNHYCSFSWTAVFAGAFSSFALSFLMNLLNVGLGFSAYSLGATVKSSAVVTFIWTLLSVFIVMLISGTIAGYLAKKECYVSYWSGALHGFLAWCVGLVMMLLLAAHLSLVLPVNLQAPSSTTNQTATIMPIDNNMTSMALARNANARSSEENLTVNSKNTTKAIAAFTLQIFSIFLVAAFASCLGGHIGMFGDESGNDTENDQSVNRRKQQSIDRG